MTIVMVTEVENEVNIITQSRRSWPTDRMMLFNLSIPDTYSTSII